jgi:hypothetical protein
MLNIETENQNSIWWCMPIFPATREVEIGRLQLEASLGKVNERPYLKNKLKAKGLAAESVNLQYCRKNKPTKSKILCLT